jgi:hypothetical protein
MPAKARAVDRVTGEVITDSAIRCRTYGHAWDEFTATDMGPPTGGLWRLSLRCVRCTTERHDIIDIHGGVTARRYIYPEGYRDVLGPERMSREEYRMALYNRLSKRRRPRKEANASAA